LKKSWNQKQKFFFKEQKGQHTPTQNKFCWTNCAILQPKRKRKPYENILSLIPSKFAISTIFFEIFVLLILSNQIF
jgi:hypothetical protein